MEINNVVKIAEGKNAIFFDYFDTIVRRKVSPEHIKRLWARFLLYTLPLNISAEELYQLRASLEVEMCEDSEAQGNDREFQIVELYRLIHSELEIRTSCEDFCNQAIKLELDLESKYQELNEDVLEIIVRIGKNTPMYVVSDFYMAAENLSELLKRHGIRDRFEGVFSSSDFQRTKATGNLFPLLMDKLSLEPNEILHLGDNKISDFESPKKFGIEAVHISRDYSGYDKSWALHASKNGFYKEINSLLEKSEISFNWFLFAVYVFIYKLYTYHKPRKSKVIYFLAREGYFLKELFESFIESIGESELFTCVYLEVSRKSTYLPSLKKLNDEHFDSLFNQYRKMSALTFLKSISLDKQLKPLLSERFSLDFVHEDFTTSEVYKFIREDKNVAEIYEETRISSRESFINYFGSLTLEQQDELHIVDVGWKGTIQNNLHRIFCGEKRVIGHYIGLQLNTQEVTGNKKLGYLFDLRRDSIHSKRGVFFESTALFEALLSAPTYSVSHYLNNRPEFFVEEKELKLYENVYKDLQADFLNLFNEIIKVHNKYSISSSDVESVASQLYFNGVFNPKESELNVFSKLEHFENFGVFEYSRLKSTSSALASLVSFTIAPRQFIGSQWWPAYTFKRTGLGWILSFYRGFRKFKFVKMTSLNGNVNKPTSQSTNAGEFQKVIDNQSKMIQERDKYIKELENRVDEYGVAVRSQDHLIKERDDYIKVLEERLNKK